MNAANDYFSQLYKTNITSLYRFGKGMGLSHDACLDIIHDIFCRLIEKNRVFETISVKQFLFRSFINRHIDIQKSRKKMINGEDINHLPFVIEVSLEDTAIEQEEKEILKQKVDYLLDILTPRQRKAVYLRFMEEMEYEDIAIIMDMSSESVRKLVFRGFEKIRNHAGNIPVFYLLSVLFR